MRFETSLFNFVDVVYIETLKFTSLVIVKNCIVVAFSKKAVLGIIAFIA